MIFFARNDRVSFRHGSSHALPFFVARDGAILGQWLKAALFPSVGKETTVTSERYPDISLPIDRAC
jgi:hypothetical protein